VEESRLIRNEGITPINYFILMEFKFLVFLQKKIIDIYLNKKIEWLL
jgi:hypothetical protein